MPLPRRKTEADLRESEIADVVRLEINRALAAYRRRLLNIVPELIEEFREEVKQGVLPGVDANAIRARLHAYEQKALGAGDEPVR